MVCVHCREQASTRTDKEGRTALSGIQQDCSKGTWPRAEQEVPIGISAPAFSSYSVQIVAYLGGVVIDAVGDVMRRVCTQWPILSAAPNTAPWVLQVPQQYSRNANLQICAHMEQKRPVSVAQPTFANPGRSDNPETTQKMLNHKVQHVTGQPSPSDITHFQPFAPTVHRTLRDALQRCRGACKQPAHHQRHS